MKIEKLVGATLAELQEARAKLEQCEADGTLLAHFGDVLSITQPFPREAVVEVEATATSADASEEKPKRKRKAKADNSAELLAQLQLLGASLKQEIEQKQSGEQTQQQ